MACAGREEGGYAADEYESALGVLFGVLSGL